MNKKRKGARRWTALALSVAMVFSGIGILPAPVKAEAADVAAAVQKTGATTERSERKMKFGDDWKFKLVNKYNINDTSVQADGVDYDDSSWITLICRMTGQSMVLMRTAMVSERHRVLWQAVSAGTARASHFPMTLKTKPFQLNSTVCR